MRGQQHFRGTPSFLPLYESERSAGVPESLAYLRDEGAPAWADVLVDLRLEPERTAALPVVLPTANRMWPCSTPGWDMRAYVVVPDEAPDHNRMSETVQQHLTRTGKTRPVLQDGVSVLMITDPDGFRFGFTVSHDKPGLKHEFATGRMAALLPGMKHLMVSALRHRNTAAMTPAETSVHFDGPRRGVGTTGTDALGYDVETLRDALRDPHTWLGIPADADVAAARFAGPFRELSGLRALIAWALAGTPQCDEETRGWVEAGLDPVETHAWLELDGIPPTPKDEFPDPLPWTQSDIAVWFAHVGGGRKSRDYALICRYRGLTPKQARRWEQALRTVGATAENVEAVRVLGTSGWTPMDAARLGAAVQADGRAVPDGPYGKWARWTSLPTLAEWAFLPVDTAIAHLRAGITPQASRALVDSGEMPDEATLAMLTSLRLPALSGTGRPDEDA